MSLESEKRIGIEWPSQEASLKAKIKQVPEDFLVQEIALEGSVLPLKPLKERVEGDGEHLHCVLVKKNLDTIHAVKIASKALRVSQKSVGFAGMKDRVAITSQLVSFRGVTSDEVERVKEANISLTPLKRSSERVHLGYLKGNKFTITLRGLEPGLESVVRERLERVELEGVPNFFGPQRFGSLRLNTHEIGELILKKEFKEAVIEYIAGSPPDSDEKRVRDRLRECLEDNDYKTALRECPKSWRYELILLNYLSKKYRDYPGAIKSLPGGLKKMFIHAFQSFIFNKALSEALKDCDLKGRELPLPGFNTLKTFKDEELLELTLQELEKEGVSLEDFKVKSLPELSSEGEARKALVYPENVKLEEFSIDELNEGFSKAVVSFELEKGCYATTVLRSVVGEF